MTLFTFWIVTTVVTAIVLSTIQWLWMRRYPAVEFTLQELCWGAAISAIPYANIFVAICSLLFYLTVLRPNVTLSTIGRRPQR